MASEKKPRAAPIHRCVCHQGSVCTEGCERGLHHDGCTSVSGDDSLCPQCKSNADWNEAGGYKELAEKCRQYCRNGHKEPASQPQDVPPDDEVSERTRLIRQQQRSGSGRVTAIMVSAIRETPHPQIWIDSERQNENGGRWVRQPIGGDDIRYVLASTAEAEAEKLREALRGLHLRENPTDMTCPYCWCNTWDWDQHSVSCTAAREAFLWGGGG